MLNPSTLAAIVLAVWAHPQGVSYLAKIDAIEACVVAHGNPCCNGGGIKRKKEEEKWRNLPEIRQYVPPQPTPVLPEVVERIVKTVEPLATADIVADVLKVLNTKATTVNTVVVTKQQTTTIDIHQDDEDFLFFLNLEN